MLERRHRLTVCSMRHRLEFGNLHAYTSSPAEAIWSFRRGRFRKQVQFQSQTGVSPTGNQCGPRPVCACGLGAGIPMEFGFRSSYSEIPGDVASLRIWPCPSAGGSMAPEMARPLTERRPGRLYSLS